MTKPLEDYDPEILIELSIWIEEVRQNLREKIDYAEQFLDHLPAKEWEFFSRLNKLIPDPKAPKG